MAQKAKAYITTPEMDDERTLALLDLYADYVATFDGGFSGADFIDRVGFTMRDIVVPLLRKAGYDYVLLPHQLDEICGDGKDVVRSMESRRKAFWRRHEQPLAQEGR